MKIQLGVYELFSRIIPGGLYIAAVAQLLAVLGLLKIDLQSMNDISLITSIGLIVGAYIIGGALDRLALAWFRLFAKRGTHTRTFANFKKSYQGRWDFDFNAGDWPILLALIRTKDLELAAEIDRHNAVSIMLRNVSLGLSLLGINSLIQSLVSTNWIYILVSLPLFSISILIIQESKKFREWFYDGIFQTTLAYRMNLENVIKPARSKSKRRSDKSNTSGSE